jgi:hypothetical protein
MHGRTERVSHERASAAVFSREVPPLHFFQPVGSCDAVPRDSILIDTLLSTASSGALRGWEARTYSVFEDNIDFEPFENNEENPLFVGYLSLLLENIWTALNITPPKEEEPVSKWILDQVNGANNTSGSLPPKLLLTPNAPTLHTKAS